MSGLCVVAVDASAYAIRAIVTGAGHELIHALECKPHESERAANWIGRIAQAHAQVRVVGSPLDDWPAGLEQQLREHGLTVDWCGRKHLMPSLVKIIRPPGGPGGRHLQTEDVLGEPIELALQIIKPALDS